jgi:hypothetical protein
MEPSNIHCGCVAIVLGVHVLQAVHRSLQYTSPDGDTDMGRVGYDIPILRGDHTTRYDPGDDIRWQEVTVIL